MARPLWNRSAACRVTPEIEKLKKEGWWFEPAVRDRHALGARHRGRDHWFPADPGAGRGQVVAGAAQLLDAGGHPRPAGGYESEFIYGGESHFDNMRGFFLANGFSQVTDENDYRTRCSRPAGAFPTKTCSTRRTNAWRRSMRRANRPIRWCSPLSNHSPFEFPDGRIELYEQPRGTDNNAVKYTDWALGRFIEKAKKSDYWKDTSSSSSPTTTSRARRDAGADRALPYSRPDPRRRHQAARREDRGEPGRSADDDALADGHRRAAPDAGPRPDGRAWTGCRGGR